jgi:hypothetical protein
VLSICFGLYTRPFFVKYLMLIKRFAKIVFVTDPRYEGRGISIGKICSLQEMLDSVNNNKLKRNAICIRAVPPKIKVTSQSLPLDCLLRVN